MHHYLIIDQGTHASRCIVFDQNLQALATKEHHVPIYRHNAQNIEQTPEKILASIYYCLDHLAQEGMLEHVKSAALVTQRSTIVAWHRKTGKALSPAISWQDTRAHQYLSLFQSTKQLREITGLPPSAHYGATKIHWLLKNNPTVQQALETEDLIIAPLASYLIKHLTHSPFAHVDYVNASRTQLFNIKKQNWSDTLLKQMQIPDSILPECKPNKAHFGNIRTFGIPLNLVTGDQNATLFAHGAPSPESLLINLGTGAFVIKPTSEQCLAHHSLLCSIAHSDSERSIYLQEGTVNGAGSAIEQITREIGENALFEQLPDWLRLIHSPPIYINTIGGLGSPWWNNTIEPHYLDYFDFEPELPDRAVAIIESIVFLLQNNIEHMKDSVTKNIIISGGLSRLDGLCQKIANLSQLEVTRSQEFEATARGAASLLSEKALMGEPGKLFHPQEDPELEKRYQRFSEHLKKFTL